jgi:hypothetical protein
MGFKEILQKLTHKDQEMNEEAHRRKIQRILDTKEMNSNERELTRFQEEERQENIKKALEYYRKRRKEDITFNHNALDTPTIMKSDWEILKEKNIMRDNSSVLKTKNIFRRN